ETLPAATGVGATTPIEMQPEVETAAESRLCRRAVAAQAGKSGRAAMLVPVRIRPRASRAADRLTRRGRVAGRATGLRARLMPRHGELPTESDYCMRQVVGIARSETAVGAYCPVMPVGDSLR